MALDNELNSVRPSSFAWSCWFEHVGITVEEVEGTGQSVGVAEAEGVTRLAMLTSVGTAEGVMIGLAGPVTTTQSGPHLAWVPLQHMVNSSNTRSTMSMMRLGNMASLTSMLRRHMMHLMVCMALPWGLLRQVGAHMGSTAPTWAK